MDKVLRTKLTLRGKLAGARERLSKRLGEELTHYDIYAMGVEILDGYMDTEARTSSFLGGFAGKFFYDAKGKK